MAEPLQSRVLLSWFRTPRERELRFCARRCRKSASSEHRFTFRAVGRTSGSLTGNGLLGDCSREVAVTAANAFRPPQCAVVEITRCDLSGPAVSCTCALVSFETLGCKVGFGKGARLIRDIEAGLLDEPNSHLLS